MNTRINQIVKLANQQYSMTYYPKEFTENLALLMVTECKSILLDMMDNGQGESDTLDQALTEINEYFGIE